MTIRRDHETAFLIAPSRAALVVSVGSHLTVPVNWATCSMTIVDGFVNGADRRFYIFNSHVTLHSYLPSPASLEVRT